MKIIKNVKLKIDEDEVLRYQKYSKNKVTKPKKIILQVTKEEIERAYNLFQSKGIYASFKIKKISFSEGKINLEKGVSSIFSQFSNSSFRESRLFNPWSCNYRQFFRR